MVREELDQEPRGEAPHLPRIRGPHGRGLRDDQPVHERARVLVLLEELPERRPFAVARQQRPGLLLEADQVRDHAVEPRRREVRALREQAVGRRARVLEVALLVADREAHVRGLATDAEAIQQPLEARVVAVVEDDEAGVDPVRLVRRVHPHRVRMAARIGVRLEHRDLVIRCEQVRGNEAGDAGTDDGDLHERWVLDARGMGINPHQARFWITPAGRNPRAAWLRQLHRPLDLARVSCAVDERDPDRRGHLLALLDGPFDPGERRRGDPLGALRLELECGAATGGDRPLSRG